LGEEQFAQAFGEQAKVISLQFELFSRLALNAKRFYF